MPIQRDYHNDTTQRERREQLDNERKVQRENDTYFSRATASVGQELGPQHRKMARQQIVGTPSYSVPRIPSGPWSAGGQPQYEPEPLGYDINHVDIGNPPEQNSHSAFPVECDEATTGTGMREPIPVVATDPRASSAHPSGDVSAPTEACPPFVGEPGRNAQAQGVPSSSSIKAMRRL
jgi:hypothetical protein